MDTYSDNSSCTTDNESLHNCSEVSATESNASSTLTIFVAVQVLLVVFILIGNTLILLAIRKGHLIRKVSYYFIANLAMADIFFGLALALRLVFVLTGSLNTETCVLILVMATVTGLSSATGILHLCLESYLAVRHIIVFKTAFTPKVAWALIVSSWLVWSLLCLLILYHPDADEIPPAACNFAHPFFNRIFLATTCIAGLLIMLVIVVIQLLTVFHVRKHFHGMLNQQQQPQQSGTTSSKEKGKESDRQKRMLARVSAMSQLVALILISFILTWGPYLLALLLHTFCPSCGVNGLHLVYLVFVVSLNSAANVVIFAIKSKEFRKAFKKMLSCRRAPIQVEPIQNTTLS